MFNLDEIRAAGDRDSRDRARRLKAANIPPKFAGLEWSDIDTPPDEDLVRSWCDLVVSGAVLGNPRSDWFAKGLLLYGNPGVGKTTLATIALQDVLKRATLATWGPQWHRPVHPVAPAFCDYYRNIIGLAGRQIGGRTTEVEDQRLDHMFGMGDPDYGFRLLLLDDVGKEYQSGSGWAAGWFEELIRRRYYQGWPTLVTTNTGPEQWDVVYGSSCASFMHEAFAVVPIQTDFDRRKQD